MNGTGNCILSNAAKRSDLHVLPVGTGIGTGFCCSIDAVRLGMKYFGMVMDQGVGERVKTTFVEENMMNVVRVRERVKTVCM